MSFYLDHCNAVLCVCSAACDRRPPEVKYGLVRFHTLRHGDRARYRCNPGFELVGDTYLTCLHGRWTGNVPTCKEGQAASKIFARLSDRMVAYAVQF